MKATIEKKMTTKDIMRAASLHFKKQPKEIVKRSRKRETVYPRQVVQHIAWKYRADKLKDIAAATNVKQHGTVLSSFTKIKEECEVYPSTEMDVEAIELRLLSSGHDMTIPVYKPNRRRLDVHCPNCDWEGLISECNVKHFGDYTGDYDNPDMMGWDEWDDLVCPKCDKVVDYLT